MKESEILKTLFGNSPPPEDDCYFLKPDKLVTTDSLVEGTHFLHKWSSPKQIAEKLIEVNVSDIAASGGTPSICFLNLGLSELSKEREWVEEFTKAFRMRLKKYKLELVGGDTFYSKNTHLTLTVFGKTKKPWFRNGGKEGDILYLTGEIGDSQLGLQILKKNIMHAKYERSITKHLTPMSRSELVPKLQKFEIHACMDVTDGLIQDCEKLAQASNGHLEIQMESLPLSKIAYENLGWEGVLSSGEELELLILSDKNLPKKIGNVKITAIGRFTKDSSRYSNKSQVRFLLGEKEYSPKSPGFLHF